MNRQELARVVAEAEKVLIADVLRVIDAMTADVEAHIAAGGLVCWPRFGTWYARYRRPRLYHTPKARKRAARAGEAANKFISISLPKWDFCFDPARNFKKSVRPKKAGDPVIKPKTPRAPDLVARLAERLDLSTVEIGDVMITLLAEIVRQVSAGAEVRLDGFGCWRAKKRPMRRYSVVTLGGGRAVKMIGATVVPVFVRHVDVKK